MFLRIFVAINIYILRVGGKEVQIIDLVSNVSVKQSAKRQNSFENTLMPPKKIIRRSLHPKGATIIDESHKLVLPEPSLQHQV